MMRFIYLVVFLMVSSACGFTPVHQQQNSSQTNTQLQMIQVDVVNTDRLGQLYQIALENALHPDNDFPEPTYRLNTSLTQLKQALVIERDASITRFNIILDATYQLSHIETGETLVNKRLQRITSYNVSESDFGTFVAEKEALERGVKELARTISMELITTLQNHSE